MRLQLEFRVKVLVNVDGLRRCYDGCFEGWEQQWSKWGVFDSNLAPEKRETTLEFWRDLNDYAVSQRGESARREYRVVEIQEEEAES